MEPPYFYVPVSSWRIRVLLWILDFFRNCTLLESPIYSHSHSIYRLCLTLRTKSFWGATVVTNLLAAIPYISRSLNESIWAGFSVDEATLRQFFPFRCFLPLLQHSQLSTYYSLTTQDLKTPQESHLTQNPPSPLLYNQRHLKCLIRSPNATNVGAWLPGRPR